MRGKRKRLIFLLVLAGILSVAAFIYTNFRPQPIVKNEQAFLQTLNTAADFRKFAGAPLDEAYPNISSVKAVYDLRRKQIYFINSTSYRLHYDFCAKVLGYKLGLRLFNIANYGDQRDYYLANIHYLKKSNQYVLEFGSSDEIDSLQIIDMYEQVSQHTFIKNNLKLLLNNTNTLHYFAKQHTLPTCDIAALNNGLNYQMIQAGACVGRLVFCNDLKSQYLSVMPNDILVVKGSPADIPLCKAIISTSFQTPLSHIQVLSHNKKLPSAYLENSFTHDSLIKYNGKIVELVVGPDTLMIKPSSETAMNKRRGPQVNFAIHTSIQNLIPIEQCKALGNADIGTKAKGFSDLKLISAENDGLFQTPEGAFVIPFYFYCEHLKRAKIEALRESLLHCAPEETNKIDQLLAQIRSAINATPISKELLSRVEDQMRKNRCGNAYRFRSSSNVEDLLNFSGAGLYDSKTGELDHPKKSVERAIKKVWASMYHYRAYQERYFANVNEHTAGMSILVHRSFPEEDINGVIITKNIYRADYPAIVINAQKGDVSTVSPPDSVTCEQLILTENRLMNPFSKRISAKYLSYSSLHPQGPLLSYDQLLQLQKSARAITTYYASRNMAWDIEFKFEGGRLFIKQVRPYR